MEGKDLNINPMFNSPLIKKEKSAPEISKPRKRRSDKKHDIKIPVSKSDKQLVLLYARRKSLSVTKYCTTIVNETLLYNYDYE